MARCRHGFELSRVSCPSGCGGADMKQHLIGNGRVVEEEPKKPRKAGPVTDAQIEQALTGASSVRAARERICMDDQDFKTRCQAVPKLAELYAAAKARGLKTGRARYGWRPV